MLRKGATMSDEIGLFEAIYTQRAIRSFKPDPVPKAMIEKVLEAATKAPSGANSQPWAFVVVDDEAERHQLNDIARATFASMYAGALARQKPGDPPPMPNLKAMIDTIDTIPVWVIVCCTAAPGPGPAWGRYGSIFPAVQNLLLAARGVGLGAVVTGLFGSDLPKLRAVTGIPEDVEPLVFVPLGYPDKGRYGPTTRRPLAEVVHWNQWDTDKVNSAKVAYRTS
jgi:nitroreductase